MLVVVSMIGLMALFAWPKVVPAFDRSQVRSARSAIVNKYNQARINARQSRRRTILARNGTVLWIERLPRVFPLAGSDRDTVGPFLSLAEYGVAVRGFTSLQIDPRGLAGSGTIVVGRGTAIDSVVISGYGRVSR
jgi:type II secretory pathway pseudopilin PulG